MVTLWDKFLVLRMHRRDLPEHTKIEASTLGEALREAERIFGRTIRPATAHEKYFIVEGGEVEFDREESKQTVWKRLFGIRQSVPKCSLPPGYGNTDIHIVRGDKTLCPKQDLGFPLQAGDLLMFGPLAC